MNRFKDWLFTKWGASFFRDQIASNGWFTSQLIDVREAKNSTQGLEHAVNDAKNHISCKLATILTEHGFVHWKVSDAYDNGPHKVVTGHIWAVK